MGLFSSKKKIIVSSVVYNLAGDINDRIRYLPTTISTSILSNTRSDLGETIYRSLLNGPGIKMRSFARWARVYGYSADIGLQSGTLIFNNSLDVNQLADLIPHDPGETVNISLAEIGPADYGYWSDQWMLANHPDQADDLYEIDFNEETNTVYLTFPDTTVYSFVPLGFDINSLYMYVSYSKSKSNIPGAIETGAEIIVGSPAEYPDTTDWVDEGLVSTPGSMDLVDSVRTVISYSDGRPDEVSEVNTPSTGSFYSNDQTYSYKTYHGFLLSLLTDLTSTVEYQHNLSTGILVEDIDVTSSDEVIAGGVIKTTTITTIDQSVGTQYSYRIDTQEIVEKSFGPAEILIYEQNSGNPDYDAMFNTGSTAGVFFPFIPVRIRNKFISDTYLPDIYAKNKKAYKKAVGKKYDALVDSIKENDSIGDVDMAYINYAVSLNTKEKASRKYIYKFFQAVIQQGGGGTSDYDNWDIQWGIANVSVQNWNSWFQAQSNPSDPLFGAEEPIKLPYPDVPIKRLRVNSPSMGFDMIISWSSMEESVFSGVGQPGAKQGDLWWTQGVTQVYTEDYIQTGNERGMYQRVIEIEYCTLHWQDTNSTYRTVSMWGLNHNNVVYKGKGVSTSAKKALNDDEESGFLIPLQENLLKSMSLADSTQMSTACTYVVFNCYDVVKEKWYQSSWFKVVLIIVVIVITVLTSGAGAGGGAGLLGTAASVGAALGFAGTVAIIVGTIANAIAAMLLSQILTAGANALFGEKVGAIVGAIASVVAVAYGTGYASTGDMSASFSSLATADNFMKLTVAAGKGYAGYMQGETNEIMAEMNKFLETYQAQSKALAKAYQDNLGSTGIFFDPTVLTESASFIAEPADTFLSRTLMTGTDIAELTSGMLTNFATMATTTDLLI